MLYWDFEDANEGIVLVVYNQDFRSGERTLLWSIVTDDIGEDATDRIVAGLERGNRKPPQGAYIY